MNVLYRMDWDPDDTGQWHLDHPRDATGQRVNLYEIRDPVMMDVIRPLRLGVYSEGHALDVSFVYLVPIVSEGVADVLRNSASDDVQLIPAKVDSTDSTLHLVNILSRIDCIDYDRTEGRLSPDGSFTPLGEVILRAEAVSGSHMFRPVGWEMVVVTSDLRDELERLHPTGVTFRRVS